MNVLVDTSVWSLALRRNPLALSSFDRVIVSEYSELVREGRLQILGLIRQELLTGIRTPAQFERIREILRPFADEPCFSEDHELAAKMSNQCREKGLNVSSVDILICAVAISRSWMLFTTDSDFVGVSRVLPLKLHVPRK